jgi:putative membrane-bound dehydrogenase-like protein
MRHSMHTATARVRGVCLAPVKAVLTAVLAAVLAMPMGIVSVAAAEPFPAPTNSEPASRGGPPSAATVAAEIALPPGFTATVMAAEPAVQNPIALAWDHRGRLWIAENYTYAERAQRFDLGLRDRVLVFADTDGDGVLDDRRVFTDAVQMLTGIEVGHGGVWLLCPPRLLFIPDRDRDDEPDGPAETVLDGFDVAESNSHNFANGLRFGPDGWLYGRCGHSCPARIGRPGCPDEHRLPMVGGMWRYSPLSGRAEVLTVGTTNPWGHDWTAEGEGFFVNTVNGHLWHLIPGAHYRQPYGRDPNPHCYETIDQHADHFHFDTGAGWQKSRDGSASDLGGGHAHSGCMIYAGTNWPADLRGRLFTLNFHGRRANQEIIARAGSGYSARHGDDLFFWQDPWFRGIELASGPDGSVVVLDWSDTGECHEHDGVHRTSGRIYRLAHGQPRLPPAIARGFDLSRMADEELARLLRHADGWWVGQARLILCERTAAGRLDARAIALLREQFDTADALAAAEPAVSASAHRVRALLALHRTGDLDPESLLRRCDHPDEHVRTWAIRLLTEDWPLDAARGPVSVDANLAAAVATAAAARLDRLAAIARSDASGLVRLALASTLQRLPVPLRPRLARALVGRDDDAADQNLPLLVWYGLIPVADADPSALVNVAAACRGPTTRRLIARRLAALVEIQPSVVDRLLVAAIADQPAGGAGDMLGDTLAGLTAGLAGWRRAPRPASWDQIMAAAAALPAGDAGDRSRRLADELAVVFGDGRAVAAVRALAVDATAPPEARLDAVATLIDARPPDLREVCTQLLADPATQAAAARGLALFDDPVVAALLVDASRKARGAGREAILTVLASRRSFAAALLDALDQGRLTAGDLPAGVVRQLHALGDADLSRRLTAAWGQLRESSAERRTRIEQLATVVNSQAAGAADLVAGRRLFEKTCASCHRLYGAGGQLAPDLTGSGRHDLGYLLENIVDPSAVVNRDWRLSIVSLSDGRVLTGVVVAQNERSVTLQGLAERQTIPADEIDEIKPTDRSPMPDGLLDQLTEPQIRDLIAYLRHPVQVPLPE